MECASAVKMECCESGAPKGTDRFLIGHEAAGPGKAAPGLQLDASLQVPIAERFTPYLSTIGVRARWVAGSFAERGTCSMRRLPPLTRTSRTWSRTSLMPDLFRWRDVPAAPHLQDATVNDRRCSGHTRYGRKEYVGALLVRRVHSGHPKVLPFQPQLCVINCMRKEPVANAAEVTRFVREVIGCNCPDEVFRRIEIRLGSSAIRSCSADRELRIGGRLLIVVTSEPETELSSHLAEVIAEGKRARDDSKLNRFRLVVQTDNAAEEREKLLQAFEAVSDKDERTHMHVLQRGEVPSFA